MSPVRAALLGLVTLTGSGCITPQPFGADGPNRSRAEQSAGRDQPQFASPTERRANDAWEQVRLSPGRKHSEAYGEGFRAGFVGAAESTSEPPCVLPLRYRLAKYRSADGDQSASDWSDGFQRGAAVAHATGSPKPSGVPAPTAPRLSAHPITPFPTATATRTPEHPPAPGPFPTKPAANNRVVAQPPAPAARPPAGTVATAPGPAELPKPIEIARVSPPAAPSAPPAVTRPPVVVVESTGTPAVVPASASVVASGAALTSKDEFGPWLPSKALHAPTIVRDP